MDRAKNKQALKQLAEIKKRREDRLSRDLSSNQQAILSCESEIVSLQQSKKILIPKWQLANGIKIDAPKYALHRELKKHYTVFFNEHEKIINSIRQKKKEKEELIQHRQTLHEALNHNRIEQEKIKYLGEKMK